MVLTPLTIGLDEVGRGALAGPLVVGAVSLEGVERTQFVADLLRECGLRRLRDSKQLSALQRQLLFSYLENRIVWAVGEAGAAEIDHFRLTAAVSLAAERAMASLKKRGYRPVRVLADAGLFHPFERTVPTERFVRGDENILEITLASIMAKVWRDRLLRELAPSYPDYGFETNVGYGTPRHLAALGRYGMTAEHRRLFLRPQIARPK